MDEACKAKVTGALTTLMSDLCVSDILPYLIQSQTISLNQVDEIEAESTRQKQVMKFVKIIVTRGQSAYGALCKSLLETGQSHLVEAMESVQNGATEIYKDITKDISQVESKVLQSLQSELKEHYHRTFRYISPIPWSEAGQLPLEQVYTELQVIRGVNRKMFQPDILQRQNSGSFIGIDDVFEPHQECASPKKILIEGEPGMGKSTLCYKLAYDWSRGSKNNAVEKLGLVIFLSARDMPQGQHCNIADVVKTHLLPDDFCYSADDIASCLKENQEKLLFIIDGFDEISEECLFINKLIQGKLLSKSSILVTSRPSCMMPYMKYFDSVLRNIGYSYEQRVEFVDKFMKSMDVHVDNKMFDDFKLKLESDGMLHDVGRNPLNLSILCILLCEFEGQLPSSLSALYKAMHDFITQRAIQKLEMDEHIFERKLKPLYKVAYENLLQGKYQSTSKELGKHCDIDMLQHIGFFTKEIKISRFSQVTYYNFTHKSFQEFFAALYISQQDSEIIPKLLKELLQYRSCHVTAIFLCGLLEDDENRLQAALDVISEELYLPHKLEMEMGVQFVIENHNSHLLFRCLAEIDLHDKSNKFLETFHGWKIGHVCFSLPNCSDGCVKGLIAYLAVLDKTCACKAKMKHRNSLVLCEKVVKVTLQMLCLDRRPRVYSPLMQYLCSSKHCGWLHVTQISSDGHSSPHLTSIFQTFSKCAGHCLHSLELDFLNIASTALIANIHSVTSTFTWLKFLKLYECQSSYILQQIINQIPDTSKLESLTIFHGFLGDDACQTLCEKVTKLQHLHSFHFSDNVVQTDVPIFYQNLLEALECRQLQFLGLSHLPSRREMARKNSIFPINEESSIFVSPSMNAILTTQTITHLSIYKSYLGENMLRVLAQALSSQPDHLQTLELQANHITSFEALDELLQVLCQLKNLKLLNLRGTQLSESNLHVLVDLIKSTPNLKYLAMASWAGFIDHLALAIQLNTSLEFLELHKLQFGSLDNEVSNLADAIRNHPKLQVFRIGCNQTPPIDMQELIDASTTSKTIHSLMFVNFGMQFDDLAYLAERVGTNENIRSLDIKGNNITEAVADKFYQCLEGRKKLKFLNVSQSVVKEAHSAVQRLKERVILLKVDWF